MSEFATSQHGLLDDIRSCQVQTPAELGEAMVAALDGGAKDHWLEPCVGKGRLLSALAASGVDPQRIRGLDLDPEVSEADDLGQVLRGTEFLAWASATEERFERILANPPYLPLSKCPPAIADAAKSLSTSKFELRPSANCWCAFLLASMGLLKTGGSLCFVLPAAWEYADYAANLRRAVSRGFREVTIYRSLVPLFPSVQEGSVVVLARGFGQPSGGVSHLDFSDPKELISALREGEQPLKGPSSARIADSSDNLRELGTELTVSIGAVTGDNKFFLLSEAQRKEAELPLSVLVPVLTRARHLQTYQIDREKWEELKDEGERIWLFRPGDDHLETSVVARYLALSESEGGCRRDGYKVSRRDPWHRTPLPAEPHGFLSGMTGVGPWVSLNAMPELTATNTLYTVRFRSARTPDDRAAWALALMTTTARSSMRKIARRYADGLRKFEPGDLRRILVPTPPDVTTGAATLYKQVVERLVSVGPGPASELADEWYTA